MSKGMAVFLYEQNYNNILITTNTTSETEKEKPKATSTLSLLHPIQLPVLILYLLQARLGRILPQVSLVGHA